MLGHNKADGRKFGGDYPSHKESLVTKDVQPVRLTPDLLTWLTAKCAVCDAPRPTFRIPDR